MFYRLSMICYAVTSLQKYSRFQEVGWTIPETLRLHHCRLPDLFSVVLVLPGLSWSPTSELLYQLS